MVSSSSLAETGAKSFEVTTAVKVNGVDTEVKVIITYDVEADEVVEGQNQLVYKQNGTSNYKLGTYERGYYYQSAEKNASFVDMLLGDYLKTSSKTGKVDGAAIFNSTASKSVLLCYNGITEANFTDYKATLANDGWTLYQENSLQGDGKQSKFASYTKGEDVVHVQYLPVSCTSSGGASTFRPGGDEIRILMETKDTLFIQDDPAALDLSHVGGVAQPAQLHVLNLFTPYADGNDVGACMIYTLADGSFFIWDSGCESDGDQIMKALRTLNKRDDGIVVAGWLLTHQHGDHTGGYYAIANNADYANELTVETVIVNKIGDTYGWRGIKDPFDAGWNYGIHIGMKQFEALADKFKGDTRVVVPHMGQVMQIRNLNLESLCIGDEDVFPNVVKNDNGFSHIAKLTFDGYEDQDMLFLADGTQEECTEVMYPLFVKELDCYILQPSHHGLFSMAGDIYQTFNANHKANGGGDIVAIWSSTHRSLKNNNGTVESKNTTGDPYMRFYTSLNYHLRKQYGGYVGEDIIADEYMTTLTFPYTIGSATKTYVGYFKGDFYDAETVKVGFVPAFRFQNAFKDATKQAACIAQLAGYNSDILIISQLDQNVTANNNMDMVNILKTKLGYPYAYFAPVWASQADGSLTTGVGTNGHLVLSKYPFTFTETIMTDTTSTENRGVAHVVIDLDSKTALDIYATHVGSTNELEVLGQKLNRKGDHFLVLGNTKIGGSGASLDNYFKTTGSVGACANSITLIGSSGISFGPACAADSSACVGVNMDVLHMNTLTAQLLGDDCYQYGVYVNGTLQGFYTKDQSVTLNAEAATGFRVDEWKLPAGLQLTSGTVNGDSISFVMPEAPVDITLSYKAIPTYSIVFDGNGAAGVMPGAVVEAGDYELPENTFNWLIGHKFAGWIVNDGQTVYKAGDVIPVSENITVKALWEAYNYTVGAAPSASDATNTLNVLEWWGVGRFQTFANVAPLLKSSNVDVAVLLHTVGTEAQIASFVAETGYPYYLCVGAEVDGPVYHVLVSKYPLTLVDTLALVEDIPGSTSPEGRSFFYAGINVEGTNVDIIVGENNGNSAAGSNQMVYEVEPWAAEIAAIRKTPLILAGYRLDRVDNTSFAHMTEVNNNAGGSIMADTSFVAANSSSLATGFERDDPGYVELTFRDLNPITGTYTVSFDANAALTGYTMRNAGNCRVMGSSVLTFSTLSTDTTTFTTYNTSSNMYYATITIPEA